MAEPIKFKDHNVVFGKGQEQYNELPGLITRDGTVYTKWKLNEGELKQIAENGYIVLAQMTFLNPFQPMNIFTEIPDEAWDNLKQMEIVIIEQPAVDKKSVLLGANSLDVLKAFGERIGLNKDSILFIHQRPYFKLTSVPVIQKAISFGAIVVQSKEFEFALKKWYK